MARRRLYIDFETYSDENLMKCGAYRYTESDNFEIMLAAYSWGSEDEVHILDLVTNKDEAAAFDAIFNAVRENDSIDIYAHNANFERQCLRKHGIDIPSDRFFCTQSKALYCGYPAKLAVLSEVLNLENAKKEVGTSCIAYFCGPCEPKKSNKFRTRNLPCHNPELWGQFKYYLKYDVLAEKELDDRLSFIKFPESEKKVYNLDQAINDRGILVDIDFAKNAQSMDTEYKDGIKSRVTGLSLTSPKQIKDFIQERTGLVIDKMGKKEIADVIDKVEKSGAAQKDIDLILELIDSRKEVSKSSSAKYTAMLASYCRDLRIRGTFQYYGAARTGRFAGRLVQLHNLPQNHLNDMDKVNGIDTLDFARYLVLNYDLGVLSEFFENPTFVLSQLIRTAFIAPKGKVFCVADFSAIEARVTAWVAHETWRLELFQDPKSDIYIESASRMFGIPTDQISKGSDLRQRGKVAELALGYGGSVNAITTMDTKKAIPDSEKPSIVRKWRLANPNIVKLWKSVESAAKRCIQTGVTQVYSISDVAKIYFQYDDVHKLMSIKLPSGRELFYPDVHLKHKTISTGDNEFEVLSICYSGQNTDNKKGGKWCTLDTYGGKLTENIVQAISRDLLVNAMFNLESRDYAIVLHIHDENVAEVVEATADDSLKAMCEIMAILPIWGKGLCLRAAGYITPYYKKD